LIFPPDFFSHQKKKKHPKVLPKNKQQSTTESIQGAAIEIPTLVHFRPTTIYSTFQVKNATMPRVGHKDLKRPHTKCLVHVLHIFIHLIHLGGFHVQNACHGIMVHPAVWRSWGSLVTLVVQLV